MGRFLKFWGTRGSCPVSGPEYRKFGGNTSCLEVRYDTTLLIIDAGTGIRPLGGQLLKEGIRTVHLFLSHTHWDHFIGFPFFGPIYSADAHLTIWAPQGLGRSGRALFQELFAREFFPVQFDELAANIEFQVIQENNVQSIGDLEIDFHRINHPGVAFSFKIKTPSQTIGYVTDNEICKIDKNLIDFYKHCDLFIHEAQYSPEEYLAKLNWGHSSLANAALLIGEILPLEWIVTHHDPKHTDTDLKAFYRETKHLLRKNQIACPVRWAFDGCTVELC